MRGKCIKCGADKESWLKHGSFIRLSDKKRILRFKCGRCLSHFSQATFQLCYRQKKRRVNPKVFELLVSGVSQRRAARILKLNRKTVVRKFLFLAKEASFKNFRSFFKLCPLEHVQFDDLETIEHTKLKPVSVTMAVAHPSRKILAFSVSQMPAKGHLAGKAVKKYGYRQDLRAFGREEVFSKLRFKMKSESVIESDENPHYKPDVRRFLPQAKYKTYLGQRGAVVGQGELKKVAFDPLFSINHTFAMLRANINRLIRKTWCTTKRSDRLKAHIELYVYFHNEILLKKSI
jgi:transposase-like protein